MAEEDKNSQQGSTSEQFAASQDALLLSGNTNTFIDPSVPRPARFLEGEGGGYPANRIGSYTGPNRVGADNKFEYVNGVPQQLYDEVRDARNILDSLGPLDRKKFLKDVQVALGSSYRPSRLGLTDTDVNAVGYVLRTANSMGRTADVALTYMIEQGGGFLDREGGSGGGRTYTVTSADDLKPLANELALSLYGRALDPKTMNRIIRAVQQEEVGYQSAASGGGMVERSAAPTNIITQELMEANPEEAMVAGTASVVEMVRKALGTV